MAISMLKIRRPLGRLIFNMGIAIPGKTVFLIETAPCLLKLYILSAPTTVKLPRASGNGQYRGQNKKSRVEKKLYIVIRT